MRFLQQMTATRRPVVRLTKQLAVLGTLHALILCGGYSFADLPEYLHPENELEARTDRFCGSYALWHVLRLHGVPSPIRDLVRRLQPSEAGSTVQELCDTIREHGLRPLPLRLDLGHVARVTQPFIVFLPQRAGHATGHYLLYVPTGHGRAVVLNGTREPVPADLGVIASSPSHRGTWDGTAILIDRRRPAALHVLCITLGGFAGGAIAAAALARLARPRHAQKGGDPG